MIKKIVLALLGLVLVVGVIAGIKVLQIRAMIAQGSKFVPPPATVSTVEVTADSWEAKLTAVGTLDAVQGVMVAAELSGKVMEIAFDSGQKVKTGELLVRQDVSSEQARLPGAEASADLTRRNRVRFGELLDKKFISQAEFDAADAQFRQAQAELDDIRAAIEKKTVRAPFSGDLGIRQINLGQILSAGDAIVTLQTLDPIYVNFQLPQQALSQLQRGLAVRVSCDSLPGESFAGKLSTINPEVDPTTRNVRVQGTLSNRQGRLRPGMFVTVEVLQPQPLQVLTIPETAVLYAPYSNSVFVVEEKEQGQTGETGKVLRQQFVELGETRGDFVAVTSGLEAGQVVASTGVFKLRNGQDAVIDNRLNPEFKLEPKPANN